MTKAAVGRRTFLTGAASAALMTAASSQEALPFKPSLTAILSDQVGPSDAWTGEPGSGYAGHAPIDPERITAKPWCQLLVVPNQRFSDDFPVAVTADASGALKALYCHCEGNVVQIPRRAWFEYQDVNGLAKSWYGWTVKLNHRQAMARTAQGSLDIYFEAVPDDPSMQSTVIGPYRFYPRAEHELHDAVLSLRQDAPPIPGQRYQSIAQALAYCRENAKLCPRITIEEDGRVWPIAEQAVPFPGQKTWADITVAPGVKATLANAAGGAGALPTKPRYAGLHFIGSGLTLDIAKLGPSLTVALYLEDEGDRTLWLDGCAVTCGAPSELGDGSSGRGATYDGGPPRTYWLRPTFGSERIPGVGESRFGEYYATDVTASDLPSGGLQYFRLVRGCTLSRIGSDVIEQNWCVHNCRVEDVNPYAGERNQLPALRVSYSGKARATLSKTGGNGVAGDFVLAEDGVTKLAIPLAADPARTRLAEVARAINATSGWSATVLDDSRAAVFLNLHGAPPSRPIPPTRVERAPIELVTVFDMHSDVIQMWAAASNARPSYKKVSNRVFSFITALQVRGTQPFFWDHSPQTIFEDNCIENCVVQSLPWAAAPTEIVFSQFASVQSHVVVRRVTIDGTGWLLRSDTRSAGGAPDFQTYSPDRYCAFDHCALEQLTWSGPPSASLRVVGLSVRQGSLPPGAKGKIVDARHLWADPAKGDYAPRSSQLMMADGVWSGALMPDGSWNVPG